MLPSNIKLIGVSNYGFDSELYQITDIETKVTYHFILDILHGFNSTAIILAHGDGKPILGGSVPYDLEFLMDKHHLKIIDDKTIFLTCEGTIDTDRVLWDFSGEDNLYRQGEMIKYKLPEKLLLFKNALDDKDKNINDLRGYFSELFSDSDLKLINDF